MRYFLVDYENISNGGLKNLINIDKGDYTIVVFYSDNAKTIDLHTFAEIINHGNVKLIKTYTGKNAMDFQLVSYLGWLLKNNDKSQYNNKLQVADTVNSEEDSENETVQIPYFWKRWTLLHKRELSETGRCNQINSYFRRNLCSGKLAYGLY